MIVKNVDIDDSAVDYSKAGTYEVIYTITLNGDKFRDFVKDNNINIDFDTDGDTIVVKTTVTITVATKEDTEKAIESGNTNVVTEETKESVKSDNKSKANDNAVVSTPTKNSGNTTVNAGGNNSSDTKTKDIPKNDTSSKTSEVHTHSWDGGTVTVQPTCTSTGTKVYHCSCGATKSESVNANGHSWVHHNAKTHDEKRVVQDAYDDETKVTHYVCGTCGKEFDNDEDAGLHVVLSEACQNYHSKIVTIKGAHHEAVYETVTITDEPEYWECSVCHARK